MDTTTTIRPRDVGMVVHDRREGDPVSVTLKHKPTGLSASASADSLDMAKEGAMGQLRALVLGTHQDGQKVAAS